MALRILLFVNVKTEIFQKKCNLKIAKGFAKPQYTARTGKPEIVRRVQAEVLALNIPINMRFIDFKGLQTDFMSYYRKTVFYVTTSYT